MFSFPAASPEKKKGDGAQLQVDHLGVEQAVLHLGELGACLVHAAVARRPRVRCQRVLHLLHRVDDGLDKVGAPHLDHIVAGRGSSAVPHPRVLGGFPLVLRGLTRETLNRVSRPREVKARLGKLRRRRGSPPGIELVRSLRE